MTRWSVVVVIGVLCVLVSAAVKINAFADARHVRLADSLDSSLYEDVSLEGLRAQQNALCSALTIPTSDCVCIAIAATICIVGVYLLDPNGSKAIPVAGLLLLSTTCVHLVKKTRGQTLRKKYDDISELVGTKTMKSLID